MHCWNQTWHRITYILKNSTFLCVQVNFHSGVSTGVEYLTSVDLQDGHGSGSAKKTQTVWYRRSRETLYLCTSSLMDLKLQIKTMSRQKTWMLNDTPGTGLNQIFWSSSLEKELYSIKWILHKRIYGQSAPPEVMKACQAGVSVRHTKAWLLEEKKKPLRPFTSLHTVHQITKQHCQMLSKPR